MRDINVNVLGLFGAIALWGEISVWIADWVTEPLTVAHDPRDVCLQLENPELGQCLMEIEAHMFGVASEAS